MKNDNKPIQFRRHYRLAMHRCCRNWVNCASYYSNMVTKFKCDCTIAGIHSLTVTAGEDISASAGEDVVLPCTYEPQSKYTAIINILGHIPPDIYPLDNYLRKKPMTKNKTNYSLCHIPPSQK